MFHFKANCKSFLVHLMLWMLHLPDCWIRAACYSSRTVSQPFLHPLPSTPIHLEMIELDKCGSL